MYTDYTGLLTDKYELTMAQAYFDAGVHHHSACFDYFFRTSPFGGGYAVYCGLSDLVWALERFRFDSEAIVFLRQQGYREDFLKYLSHFHFRGAVHSVREGEVVFAYEPTLRIEGTLIETQLVETLVLNILNFQSLIATKAARMRFAGGLQSGLSDFGFRRAHGVGGIVAAKAAIVGGFDSTSNLAAAYRYDLAAVGTMAHSFVQSYDDELTAFRAFARSCPDHCILLVDTYDTLGSGVPNAIRVAKEMEQKGLALFAVRLDSGDLAYMARRSRKMLDAAGLGYVKIAASNQLDEYVIRSLLQQGAPINLFGVGTRLVVGDPDGALDGIYKLSMADHQPRLKISDSLGKATLPAVKKILRYTDQDGLFVADAVLLQDQSGPDRIYHPIEPNKTFGLSGLQSQEILLKMMTDGRKVDSDWSVSTAAAFARERLGLLPDEYKRFENPHIYKVGVSRALLDLRDRLISEHRA